MSDLLKKGIISSLPFDVNCKCSKENAISEIGREELMDFMEQTVNFMENHCVVNDYHPVPMIITAVVANITKASFAVLDEKAREVVGKGTSVSESIIDEVAGITEALSKEAGGTGLGDWRDVAPIKTGIKKNPIKSGIKKPVKKPAKKKE
jgi:hypothetical protein